MPKEVIPWFFPCQEEGHLFIIFGLGNPGSQYVGTRHNAGFELLDFIAEAADIEINKTKFKSMVGEGFWHGEKVILIKPMTYMNLSGEAVVAALNFYKPEADQWVVAYDDIDLKPGAIRIREKGSAGGHNGMKSIIGLTGTNEFNRVRIGVGGPRGNVVSHVLGKFTPEEEKLYVEGLVMAREAVETILRRNVKDAMSKFNSSGKPPKKPKGDTRVKAKAKGENNQVAEEDVQVAKGFVKVDKEGLSQSASNQSSEIESTGEQSMVVESNSRLEEKIADELVRNKGLADERKTRLEADRQTDNSSSQVCEEKK